MCIFFNALLCWLLTFSSCFEFPKENFIDQKLAVNDSFQFTPCAEVEQASQTNESTGDELKILVKPKTEVWNAAKPLIVCVTLKNNSSKPFSINLGSSFSFSGGLSNLDTRKLNKNKTPIPYDTWRTWRFFYQPQGEIRQAIKEDYVELLPGESYTLELTAGEMRPNIVPNSEKTKQIDSKFIPSGEYWLVTNYGSGNKKSAVLNGWEGTTSSESIKLTVKNDMRSGN